MSIQDPIIVVGHPRSGTSLVAGALARSGAWCGTCTKPSADNRGGFYENRRLSAWVRTQLANEGHDPLGVRALPPKQWDPGGPEWTTGHVQATLETEGYPGGPWMWKNCKILLFWRWAARNWPQARWVLVRRTDTEIVASCERTSFMRQHTARMHSDAKWAYWMASIDQYVQRMRELEAGAEHVVEIWNSHLGAPYYMNALRDVVAFSGLVWDERAMQEWVQPGWLGGQ